MSCLLLIEMIIFSSTRKINGKPVVGLEWVGLVLPPIMRKTAMKRPVHFVVISKFSYSGTRRPARPKEHHAQDPEGCCHPQARQGLVMRFMYGCQTCDFCHAQKVSLLLTIVLQKIVLSHGN